MNYVNLLFITPLAAVFIAEKSGVMDAIKWKWFYKVYSRKTKYRDFRIKPFDCAMCLSFWMAAAQIRDWNFILYPFAAAAIGALISRL